MVNFGSLLVGVVTQSLGPLWLLDNLFEVAIENSLISGFHPVNVRVPVLC